MSQKNPVFYLNNNDSSSLLAFGLDSCLRIEKTPVLDGLQEYIDKNKSEYIFGFLSYDIKNEIEKLESDNFDNLDFPIVYFFVPKYVVHINKDSFVFEKGSENEFSSHFVNEFVQLNKKQSEIIDKPIEWKARTSKNEYLKSVNEIKSQIQHGNIYEANYCQEFYAADVIINNPVSCYNRLNRLSKAPFSSFINIDNDLFSFCTSPERFIKKTGNKLISQPIKGTAPRGRSSLEDKRNMHFLSNSSKDYSENVMIVDLVRNDFSKIAKENSVKVDELCGLYSFETVHQLISTVSCELESDIKFKDIIEATYPMGSMTGAPKLSAMSIIEEKENFKRGLYSGSIGYIKPNGDFDFNVVIRSLLYNKSKKYLSCSVGGAITYESDPESEFEECQVKVGKLMKAMNG